MDATKFDRWPYGPPVTNEQYREAACPTLLTGRASILANPERAACKLALEGVA